MYDSREYSDSGCIDEASTSDDEAVGTSVSNGAGAPKLRIKIRTKTATSEGVAITGEVEDGDQKVWACKDCNRTPFNSEKALHGHMRMHNSNKKRKKDKTIHALELDKYSSQKRPSNTGGGTNMSTAIETKPRIDHDADVLNAAIILMSFANPTEYSKSWFGSALNSDEEENKEGDANADINVQASSRWSNTCRLCGKSFAKYQALGGHMTKHKQDHKDKGGAGEGCSAQAVGNGQSKGLHQCSLCDHEPFETGQALGGHMRAHFVRPGTEATGGPSPLPPPPQQNAAPAETGGNHASAAAPSLADHLKERGDCNSAEAGSFSGSYAHDFDLNEFPEQLG